MRQPLLDRPLNTDQSDTKGVLCHFTDATDPSVTKMIDVVDLSTAIADIHERPQGIDNVFLGQHAGARGLRPADPPVELHAADARNIVALGIEEQVMKQVLGGILGRRLTGTHHAVDLDEGVEPRDRGIDPQGIGDIGTAIQVVHIQRLDVLDALLDKLLDDFAIELVIGARQQLAGALVHNVMRKNLAVKIFLGHHHRLGAGVLQLANVAGRDAPTFLNDNLAADLDVEGGRVATQALRNEAEFDFLGGEVEIVLLEEQIQHLLV